MDFNRTEQSGLLNHIEIGVGAWAWGDRYYWNYGGTYNNMTIETMFESSIKSGVNFFDTAEVYGQGQSERYLGDQIKRTVKQVLVATKFFPYPWRIRNSSIENALDKSLERLQLDNVFLYQIHWPRSFISLEKMMDALCRIVESGKSIGVGISNFDLVKTKKAHKYLKSRSIPLVSNQVEYHLLNRRIETEGLLKYCLENDIRIISYSPLAQGILSGKYSLKSPPPGIRSRRYSSYLNELEKLLPIMKEIGLSSGNKSPSQVALNWLVCKNTLPIPGSKNLDQLISNNESIGWRLTTGAIEALDSASGSLNN
ncbi:aldo/keto reductase [Chloroflexota bacterium]